MSTETMTENWSDLKERIQAKWSHLTDHILEQGKDSKDKLVSIIQRMTGDSREKINEFVESGGEMACDWYGRAAEAVQAGSQQVQEGVKYARESIETCTEQTGKFVQARPVESLLATFAVGVATGLVLEMVFRSRPTPQSMLQSHLNQMQSHLNNLQNQLPQMPSMASLPSYHAVTNAFSKFMKEHFNCA
jgi:ElaB/YqjD/DUF883 family membrane-anchored ribosome-binding protein